MTKEIPAPSPARRCVLISCLLAVFSIGEVKRVLMGISVGDLSDFCIKGINVQLVVHLLYQFSDVLWSVCIMGGMNGCLQ